MYDRKKYIEINFEKEIYFLQGAATGREAYRHYQCYLPAELPMPPGNAGD